MRLAFLLNPDKTFHLFAITGNILPEAKVVLSFLAGKPKVQCDSSTMWALEEQGRVLVEVSKLIAWMDPAPATPSAFARSLVDGILAAKGKQICIDATGALRCVDTMRDDVATYGGKDLPELRTQVAISDKPEEMAEAARTSLKREAARMILADSTRPELVDRLVLWIKAGAKITEISSGKKPSYLTVAEVFGA